MSNAREPTASTTPGENPASGRTPVRSLLLVGLAIWTLTAIANFRVPVLPDIGYELSMSTAALGAVTGAFAVGRLVCDLPAGWLIGRWPVPKMFAVAAGGLAAGSLALAVAATAAVVVVAAFVMGVASAVTNTTGMAYFSTSTSAERRGSAMAGYSASLLAGQALGPAIAGLLVSLPLLAADRAWRTAPWFGAGAAAAIAVGLVVSTARRPGGSAPAPAAHPGHGAGAADAAAIPRRERLVLYSVPFVLFFALGSMPQTLVPIIGAEDLGLSTATIGLALGLGGVFRIVGAVVGGMVSDRISRKAALVPALWLQAGGVALLAWRGQPWVWMAAIAVMSVASFGVSVAATMLADRSGGRRMGSRLGRFRFVGDLGLVSGPLLTAWMFEHVGQRAAVLAVAGLLCASAVASASSLRETLSRATRRPLAS